MQCTTGTIYSLEIGLLGQEVNLFRRSVFTTRLTKGRFTRYDFCLLILSSGVSFRAGRQTQRPVF